MIICNNSSRLAFILFSVFFAVPAQAQTNLNIPLEVHNVSAVANSSYPVSAVLPLPRGSYFAPLNLRLETSTGAVVPAQFSVERQWESVDNSVREIRVDFRASVTANGKTTYFVKEGSNAAPTGAVSASENSSEIVIQNNRLNIRISKTNFNFLDQVTVDGQQVINNGSQDGGYLKNRFGNVLRDSSPCTNLAPTIFEIEENGPVKARVRIERPTYIVRDESDACFAAFPEAKDPVPGFVYWIDVYNNDNRIRVHHLTLNNGITIYRNNQRGDGLHGYPLAYQEAGFVFSPFNPVSEVRIGSDGETVASSQSIRSIQESDSVFSIPGNPNRQQGSWLQVNAASGAGFAILDPYFDRTYPNGWDYDASGEVSFLSAPDGCSSCEGLQGTDSSGSGLYIVQDMAAQEKIFEMVFYSSLPGDENLNDLHMLSRHQPMGVTTLRFTEVSAQQQIFLEFYRSSLRYQPLLQPLLAAPLTCSCLEWILGALAPVVVVG